MTSACHAEDHGFESRTNRHDGFIAQSVEQRTENPCVTGSIPVEATIKYQLKAERLFYREVAQFGRALRLGRRGRRFESCLLDHFCFLNPFLWVFIMTLFMSYII